MTDDVAQALIAALTEARTLIMTAVSNAMVLEINRDGYEPADHPVIKQIDAALALARNDGTDVAPN